MTSTVVLFRFGAASDRSGRSPSSFRRPGQSFGTAVSAV
jgi:hypothetical protein